MTPNSAAPAYRAPLEDVLAYLPACGVTEYRKGQTIYSPQEPSKGLYIVASGKVNLSQIASDGTEILLEIISREELFGESALLDRGGCSDQASAYENTGVMAWTTSEVETLISDRPRLAVGLLQFLAQRNAGLAQRIESHAVDSIERRLARSLIHFGERLGTQEADGAIRMLPLTHELLSRYIGTSREVVTHYMNRFRNQGYVAYSRVEIRLHRDMFSAILLGRGRVSQAAN
jgi:CRP/FNR family cyclic AMP-dependent transcriptional regulator